MDPRRPAGNTPETYTGIYLYGLMADVTDSVCRSGVVWNGRRAGDSDGLSRADVGSYFAP